MNCARCGSSNPEGADFCMKCAAPLTPAAASRTGWDALDAAPTDLGFPSGLVLIDRFRIERQIGYGGMGRVYLAHDAVLGERVVIKVMREMLSRHAGAVKRLAAEARASMRLAHPNVVRVHDYHEAPIARFLAMEYVEGESLKDRLDREGKLGEGEARRIGAEICKGLEHAHERGVIHRDLKPGNILLGKDGSVKIADFGIARVCRDSVTRLTSVQDSGTLPYMSPEQMMGESTERSDIYSVGVILYEILAGDPPFHTGEIAEQIRSKAPKVLEGVSAETNALVLRCLEKDAAKRFRSAAELREELDGTAARRREGARARAEEERRRRAEGERRQGEEAGRKEEEKKRRVEEERRREEQRKGEREEAARAGTTVRYYEGPGGASPMDDILK